MYCIINLHHENWLIADVDKQSGGEKKLELVWKQIAKYFSKYGEKLIFEGFNEVINSAKQWDSASINSYEVVNAYNQTFVNGNNLTRYLIVNTYAAKATKSVLSGFVIPKDNIENRLIVSAHIYDGINEANNKINNLYNSFICNGIPVVIGEWGLINSSVNTEAKRIEYATQFLKTASEYGIPCLWWDDGGIFKSSSAVTNFCLYKRNTQTWYFNDLVKAIIKEGKPIPFNISNYKADYDPFQMLKIDSWKSGDYHYSTGKYLTNANRICLKEEKKLVAGEKYTATVSDQSFHILVRIMDSDGKFIKSYNLSNRDSFCYEKEGYYARISIYNAVNSTICKSFEDYKKLFEKGLKISLNGIIECEDYFESEIGQDSRGENDIKQETTDVFGMADFNNWKSGDYNCNTGCYVSNNSRICLKEYKDVKENQCFVARISDRKYNLLIRFLNKDGKLIKSSVISDGQEIVIPEGSIKIGISLYNFCNSKMEFNNFKELYENGFEALLVRK